MCLAVTTLSFDKVLRIWIHSFLLLWMSILPSSAADQPLYTLDQAVHRGIVDFYVSPWEEPSRDSGRLIEELRFLDPGIVNRFGFLYGGPNVAFLQSVANAAERIRHELPMALLGTALNEHLYLGQRELICGNGRRRTFSIRIREINERTGMVSKLIEGRSDLGWIDPADSEAFEYMICLGEFFIDNGFSLIHLENGSGVIKASADPAKALQAYLLLKRRLTEYAVAQGVKLYWGATPDLARTLDLDFTYTPMRVYTTAWANNYRNRIERPGVGVGHTFALSPNMIKDTREAVGNSSTYLFFYLDNWQSGQDDLTAFMELDAINRREMLALSDRIARANGAYFVPSLNHCYGCVQESVISDPCEIVVRPDKRVAEYDAGICKDLTTIRELLHLGSR